MGEEQNLPKERKKKLHKNKKIIMKKKKDQKQRRGNGVASEDDVARKKNAKSNESMKQPEPLRQKTSSLRKTIDPETTKYFAEVANLFQGKEIDIEELPTICSNALEETRGKEVELATDMTISHTLQNLLEGCDLDRLCGFLRNSAKGFVSIATDRFGSHVAETALRSLAKHMEEDASYSYIDETLTKLCQMVIADAASMLCSSYGSHVLRSLLCLCKGVPLDSFEEFHVTKRQTTLAERLNGRAVQSGGSNLKKFEGGYPLTFKYLVSGLLNQAKNEIKTLRTNKYSSFVLQTALKLSVGDDEALLHVISSLLGSDLTEEIFLSMSEKQEMMDLLEDTASSHLLEVIVEVAPEALYCRFLTEVFNGALFEISSHQCGNFVVQALVSSARNKDQMNLIWEELGPKFKELLELGKPGVVASILAACERLGTLLHECCRAISTAVISDSESPSSIVPHILFLESYFRNKSSWTWPLDDKMHVLGCLMLQILFRYPKQLIQPFIASLTSMDAAYILQTSKDAGGGRVIEAFLSSDVPTKVKLKVVTKLQDHFAELAQIAASSFTVEKCFASSNLSLKECIAGELLAVRSELSKTKHGPYLLRKLDIDGFASRPEQWKLRQESKESAYREFQALFGSKVKPKEHNAEASTSSPKSSKKTHKRHDKVSAHNADTDMGHATMKFPGLDISMAKLGFPGKQKGPAYASNSHSKRFIRNNVNGSSEKRPGKRKSHEADLADLAGKSKLSAGEVQQLFKPSIKNENDNEKRAVPFLKRPRR